MIFHIVQCPKCTQIQITSSNNNLLCKYCNRSTLLDKVKKEGCFYTSISNPLVASQICQKIKMNFKGKLKIKKSENIRRI
jgi:hypothetical protein